MLLRLILLHLLHKVISTQYILYTDKCKLENINPFNNEVVNISKPQPPISCTNKTELLTYVKKTGNGAILYVREEVISEYTSDEEIDCCYAYVSRGGSEDHPDNGVNITECQRFEKNVKLTNDTVWVSCWSRHSLEKIYENVHNTIISKPIKPKVEDPIGVLFIVVDSLSRLNFIRAMPETYQYLKENNFIEMKGYSKVGENTYPNAIALLTGLSVNESNAKCLCKEVGGLDKCPMIWYKFRSSGFITAYAEDNTGIGTFNYEKKGFKNPPTDFYFKPYMDATELLPTEWHHNSPFCTGPESAGERILNLARDFSTSFLNESTFGVFWMNTFSHDDFNSPFVMDGKMKEFFQDLKHSKVLENNIVFFWSDHGYRLRGEIKYTRSGWIEERMPTNMIHIPKKFQQKYPEYYSNLKDNAKMLTSVNDMYMTLEHILHLYGVGNKTLQSNACPQCRSLFEKISKMRSCTEAGIPEEYCPCIGQFKVISTTDTLVTNATDIALDRISTMRKCQNVVLDKIWSASVSEQMVFDGKQTRYLFFILKLFGVQPFLITVGFENSSITSESFFHIHRYDNVNDRCD